MFFDDIKISESQRRKKARQKSGDCFWKRIKLRTAELLYPAEGSAYTAVEEGHILFGKDADMSRYELITGRMPAQGHKEAIMQGQEIGRAHKKYAVHFQAPEYFMVYPKNFFRMLKNLVGNNEIN